MRLNKVSTCALIACLLSVTTGQAWGTDYSWGENTSGTWGVQANWSPPIGPPVSGDLAAHNDPAFDSAIIVQSDRVCRDFQGDGSEPGVRYLQLKSAWTLTAENSITGSNGLFPIRFEDGPSAANRTKLSVGTLTSGGASNLLFERDDPSQDAGDFVSITVKGDLSNSTIDFPGSANSVSAHGNAVDTDVNLPGVGNVVGVTGNVTKSTGSPSWTIGNAGSLSVGGDIGSGINVTLGSGNGSSPPPKFTAKIGSVGATTPIADTWIVTHEWWPVIIGDFTCDGTNATVNLGGVAKMTIFGDVTGGVWTLTKSAILTADMISKTVTGGDWQLVDNTEGTLSDTVGGLWGLSGSAAVTARSIDGGDWTTTSDAIKALDVASTLNPDSLTMTGSVVNSLDFGVPLLGPGDNGGPNPRISTVTIQNSSALTVAGEAWHHGGAILGQPSTLTYVGGGATNRSTYTVSKLHLNGKLVRSPGANLDVVVNNTGGFVKVETMLVDATGPTDFAVEGVTVKITGKNPSHPTLETFSPDYSNFGGVDFNPGHVFFTDSPCAREWDKARFPSGTDGDPVELKDEFNNNLFSGPSTTMPDALYVDRLDVGFLAKLITNGLAIYYTNTIDVKGTITTDGSTPYFPVPLTATLYGDFDGDFDFDAVDRARLEAAYCTCIGDADYDPLADSDCDRDVDEIDWRNFNANGGTGAAPSCTNPCS